MSDTAGNSRIKNCVCDSRLRHRQSQIMTWPRTWLRVFFGKSRPEKKPGFMGKRTAGPSEPTAPMDQQSDHERNASTQHQHNDSLRSGRHRRSGTRFKFRHKPRGPSSLYDDHCPSSHVFDHVPTCALLLAGLLAICVGSVPVEANPSGAWIARPSRKQHLSIIRPHAVGALGETSCTSLSISADLIAYVNQLSHEATLIGASGDRSRASPHHLARPPELCAPSLRLWTATPTTPSAPASRYRRPGKPLLHCRPISGCSTHRSSPSPSTFFLDRRWTQWAQQTTTYSTSRRAFPPRASPLY